MDAIRSLLNLFDIANYLPDLTLFSTVAKLVLWALMLVGPVLMLLLGLMYFMKPPAEANFSWGFRTYFGMGSVEAWRFTQKIAGATWTVLGLALLAISILISNQFPGMEPMAMLDKAVTCILWQIGLIFVFIVLINLVVTVRYDRNGDLRSEKRKNKK